MSVPLPELLLEPAKPTRPLRVLLVADKLGFRDVKLHGTGRLIVEWATAFDASRIRVYTYVLRDVGGMASEISRTGLPITFLHHRRFAPLTLWTIVRLVRRHRIDVLHLNGHGSSTFGRLAGRITGTPTIVHVHGDAQQAAPRGYPAYVRLADRLLARWTARAVAISQFTRDFCIQAMGFRPEQVEVVHNPTPEAAYYKLTSKQLRSLRAHYGIAERDRVIGVASRLYAAKGHNVLLAAFRRVLEVCPEARLLVVGDGPERGNLEAQARALGVAAKVCFTGFQEQVGAHLQLCQVTVIPSIHPEAFGLVAVESLAAGVPVVASCTGGLPEIVTDGVAGLLVEPNNVEDLAQALIRILTVRSLAADLASRSIAESQRFSMREHVRRMEHVFRTVVQEARRAPARSGVVPEATPRSNAS